MEYCGIIISGTNAVECKQVAQKLECNYNYKILRIVSNKLNGEYNNYISSENIGKIDRKFFFIYREIEGSIFIIFKEEFEQILKEKKIPIIIVDKTEAELINKIMLCKVHLSFQTPTSMMVFLWEPVRVLMARFEFV